MEKYFVVDYTGQTFKLFSNLHMTTLLLVGIITVTLLLMTNRSSFKTKRKFRYSLASLLILNELYFIIWHIWGGIFSPATSLPLHLCRISAILCALMLITKNKKIYQTTYFLGLVGAIPALITPDLGGYSFPHFTFFKFFITHGGIITAILYMTIVEGYRPSFKSIGDTLLMLNLHLILTGVINWWTGGNYFYLAHKPPSPSLMDGLGEWPWYIASLEIICVLLFFILYSPFFLNSLGLKDKIAEIYEEIVSTKNKGV